ncbi:MAG: hypothetical protein UY78_C0007G0023 [Parcubacteria group bacterium GW2011_GWA1_53_13]|nr:MAG: hypothetical protein UT56_C0019G0002 [Candidatus Levybacteria bacterium GW2011_GWB1_39_7]KKW07379.1 MAG: hypothetical protein UY42_C0013G0013 [Parcubacteria group bacterium GW2011_GWA2_49_16]KKW33607.1 MAG: hypothetical protein UY78_C0007G0023 [Parcubacteria group bacterium GW2011_GWA1_53_13]
MTRVDTEPQAIDPSDETVQEFAAVVQDIAEQEETGGQNSRSI